MKLDHLFFLSVYTCLQCKFAEYTGLTGFSLSTLNLSNLMTTVIWCIARQHLLSKNPINQTGTSLRFCDERSQFRFHRRKPWLAFAAAAVSDWVAKHSPDHNRPSPAVKQLTFSECSYRDESSGGLCHCGNRWQAPQNCGLVLAAVQRGNCSDVWKLLSLSNGSLENGRRGSCQEDLTRGFKSCFAMEHIVATVVWSACI